MCWDGDTSHANANEQNNLAEKVVKPSRKLRKERKNRAKKVSHNHSYPYDAQSSHPGPRKGKGEGC
jgi:hypothetical protein